MNLNLAQEMMLEEMSKWELIQRGWTFKWDRTKTVFGRCFYQKRVISLSAYLVHRNIEEQVLDTVRHEIAHALSVIRHGLRNGRGHGYLWQRICMEVGAKPIRCYSNEDVSTPEYRYILRHSQTGQVFHGYHKLPKNGNRPEVVRTWFIRDQKEATKGFLEVVTNPNWENLSIAELKKNSQQESEIASQQISLDLNSLNLSLT